MFNRHAAFPSQRPTTPRLSKQLLHGFSDEFRAHVNEMDVSVAVPEFKLRSPVVVVFVQQNRFPDNLRYCLLVFNGQIVQHSWWNILEHHRVTRLRPLILRTHPSRSIHCSTTLRPVVSA